MNDVTPADLILPKREEESHKGENGKVLIIGGSEDYIGAAALAGLAALRAGADMAVIAAPAKVAWAINCLSPDLITKKFAGSHFRKEHAARIVRMSADFDCVLIGNGIGKRSNEFIRRIVKRIKKPKVIDAEGINALALKDIENSVLTPHKKELRTLLENSGIRQSEPKRMRRRIGDNVLLVKGRVDTIISKASIRYNRTGNAGMTKGGTGDVLAGICAGLIAQGSSLFDAACTAAYINGNVGELLKNKKGYSFIASDMIEDIKKIKGRISYAKHIF